MTTNFFSPLSFVAVFGSEIGDPGSGMGKNQDPGSGINIPDPQHCLKDTFSPIFLNNGEKLPFHLCENNCSCAVEYVTHCA
jgi:hypothetical protein